MFYALRQKLPALEPCNEAARLQTVQTSLAVTQLQWPTAVEKLGQSVACQVVLVGAPYCGAPPTLPVDHPITSNAHCMAADCCAPVPLLWLLQNAKRKLPPGWHMVGPQVVDRDSSDFPPQFGPEDAAVKAFLDAAAGKQANRGAGRVSNHV